MISKRSILPRNSIILHKGKMPDKDIHNSFTPIQRGYLAEIINQCMNRGCKRIILCGFLLTINFHENDLIYTCKRQEYTREQKGYIWALMEEARELGATTEQLLPLYGLIFISNEPLTEEQIERGKEVAERQAKLEG